MDTNFKSPVEEQVDRLFSEIKVKHGECCINPVTGAGFVWGIDPIAEQKEDAIVALRAREWFAVNGPSDAPPLPLTHADVRGLSKCERAGRCRWVLRPVSFEGRLWQATLRRPQASLIRRLRSRLDGDSHRPLADRNRR